MKKAIEQPRADGVSDPGKIIAKIKRSQEKPKHSQNNKRKINIKRKNK